MTTKYVVRSMTTTDFDVRSGKAPVPYHIYLMPSIKRVGAYWSSAFQAEMFDSPQAAEAEAKRSLSNDHYDIVPFSDKDVPTYWELQDMRRARKAA
jgi:hypothetical protein